jgi:hypothetical protein
MWDVPSLPNHLAPLLKQVDKLVAKLIALGIVLYNSVRVEQLKSHQ